MRKPELLASERERVEIKAKATNEFKIVVMSKKLVPIKEKEQRENGEKKQLVLFIFFLPFLFVSFANKENTYVRCISRR